MENELRDKVKTAAKEYYKAVYACDKDFDYIPPSGKLLGEEELLNMIDASLDMWLTSGRFNKEFENSLAKYLNVKYVCTVNSGSSANLLAIAALTSQKLGDKRLKPGDEVLTIAAGFPTTISPIVQNGLIPVFADCNIGTYNIDCTNIENYITPKTKAIFLAHTLGNCFNLNIICEIAEKYNLWLIEDSCDALGGEYNCKKLGSIGHISTFSFYPAHHITTGEGGAVATNDSLVHKIILSYRDWGRDCFCPPGKDGLCGKRFNQQHGSLPFGYDHKYVYSHLGYNLKITDWQAAIGCAQMKKIDNIVKKRRSNFDFLYNKLSDLTEYIILPEIENNSKPSWFGFLITLKENVKFRKQDMVEYLEKNGIGTRQLFAGNILRQPSFTENHIPLRIKDSGLLYSDELSEENYKQIPNTEYIMNNTFWVGIFPALGERELTKISDTIHSYIHENI